jgi:rhamnose utilization protein RhaD (predicted bifunctional aldolase and dehydrogenase)/NAD(P)-dependent dehydrogenase (short-subunit alcohol dehydrogenase family)
VINIIRVHTAPQSMQNLWNDDDARAFGDDPVALRVYTSRLLGRDPSLVLHGGGNTSVKTTVRDVFGDAVDVLLVKGSGWDLATIEAAGFSPVRLDVLRRLATQEHVSDARLVRAQRAAMTDPAAPDASVEAVLHALIPFAFVDHTHADAVVALTNTPRGAELVAEVYGDRLLVIPYVMPGFALARVVYEQTRGADWSNYDAMVLLNHGIFTWGDTARASYDAMIRLVSAAERRVAARSVMRPTSTSGGPPMDALPAIRRAVSELAGRAMVAMLDASPASCAFVDLPNVADIATRGPLTPDHIIRTKRVPVVLGGDPIADVQAFAASYRQYFARHTDGAKTMLDAAPRWAVWPGRGIVTFGRTARDARIALDVVQHTVTAIQWSEALGGWRALPEKDLFDVEYWELEQAKLTKAGAGRAFDGRVAIVTGAASGIGRAAAEELASQGAAVVTADLGPIQTPVGGTNVHVVCDLTDPAAPATIVQRAVREFGGLDVVVSNVGRFPASHRIDALDDEAWRQAFDVNVTSHQRLLTACVPVLREGIAPSVVVVGSKNVPAPGPAQAAYSASKAALTQLARVAALELAADGIRVNVVHPNAVFDTGLWTDDVLRARADAYGKTVEEYKRSNLLGVEVTSRAVASAIVALAGPTFSCTTGAQVPVDGGNERVI